jgi:RHH-type proline utilization regulon transcriptional repressor/proline dehydrogenase/delta 1-pyrroline-5-carboxylate dehydrogenase
MIFLDKVVPQTGLRAAITAAYRMDETQCVERLLSLAEFSPEQLARIQARAKALVEGVRSRPKGRGDLSFLLQEFQLSSKEGLALMSLAEALLRVPDKGNKGRLIRDKIAGPDWQQHISENKSFIINTATRLLTLASKILTRDQAVQSTGKKLKESLRRLVECSTEPVIRRAISRTMTILAHQFVRGETIEEAIVKSQKSLVQGYTYSYDMLGEAAHTADKAEEYFAAYQHAITVLGNTSTAEDIHQRHAVSVKLSALHPRYEASQFETLMPVLYERIKALCVAAKEVNIGLVIDAEEADRLDLSLDVIEQLAHDPELQGWDGIGLAVQAYQKRAMPLLDWLIDLAQRSHRQFMVRLVKGAYWDSEIKDSQYKGLEGYPVFTRKANTDVCYLACAKKMLAVPEAIYCQFGTHNAFTVAAIMELVGERRDFEFQCLHGMGHPLYDQIVKLDGGGEAWPCRIYAPVGSHEDLLPYLVRRLLENGANSSFVNRIADENVSMGELITDPVMKVRNYESKTHPNIPLPVHLYGHERLNSRGIDLANRPVLQALAQAMDVGAKNVLAHPALRVNAANKKGKQENKIGDFSAKDCDAAIKRAQAAAEAWDKLGVEQRAAYLEKAAELLQQNHGILMAIAVKEAGKTIPSALAEVREAVDFCRYYAQQARNELAVKTLVGPTGELNQLSMHGRGVTVCISPWNFPLAIFTGQIVAALVTGNTVIAKPAEQTPQMATKVVELLHQAGIPQEVLQLMPGPGETVGATLVADPRVQTIIFTGSTETARSINQTLAQRPGPLATFVAETGGQNAMIADSTAFPEQLVLDVIQSAFDSAGQRCSALRVLFLQEEIADKVIHLLQGAMAELKVGNPELINTDIGPVIDLEAKSQLDKHIDYLDQHGKLIYRVPLFQGRSQESAQVADAETFFAPCAYEISELSQLKREVFGPILHVIRYRAADLDKIIEDINNTGYGLTLGIQSRILETIDTIQTRVRVGNVYVNRNMIGAVVGVQPFGGEGLSGTGPKAGGPHYLARLCVERSIAINTTATGGNTQLLALGE